MSLPDKHDAFNSNRWSFLFYLETDLTDW